MPNRAELAENPVYRLVKPLLYTLHEISRQAGFKSWPDLLGSVFGIQFYTGLMLKAQVTLTVAASTYLFFNEWIWQPPLAAWLLMSLDLFNGFYGWRVAKRVKGAPFSLSEFSRTFAKIFATIVFLAAVRWAVKAYPYYGTTLKLCDFVFAWLFSRKLLKLGEKMALLKVQEAGITGLIMTLATHITRGKYGDAFVASLQQQKKVSRRKQPAAPAALPPSPVPPDDTP